MIRTASVTDAQTIAKIYNHYIKTSIITFETKPVPSQDMANRIEETLTQQLPYLVIEEENKIVGYAYASKWKGRCAYRFSVEATVYLAPNVTGKGYGTRLYQQLFEELESLNYHAVIAGISLPNPTSIALHENMGMQKVAHFKQVGFKFERWIDVGYWQKFL
ncbi:arsinothricin resistance N-acetyltransferase ArsN1 family B [Kangiella sp. TOML190]|uniref:arsinothricin resistance N-acetyltransferase ArsN1 family B n=1 Tax=Kangiella sp. TOML190 TaxID=2931351 RepID=UPI00203A499A|nr:arsinothricin resistance N-acetyltransferase ArsN1 family B [Kangiella sp. TOML190]